MNLDPSSSPLAFFAAEMKRLRAENGMTQEDLAKASGFSSALVAQVETCRLLPSEQFATFIDKAFGGSGHFKRLQELVDNTSARPWFHDLAKAEQKATEVRLYSPYVVPGLLQTEDYARCCVLPTRPELTVDEIGRAVALRMTRQKILEQDEPPKLWAIIDESALGRFNGNAEIMAAQREHLLKMSERPNITVQVIPDSEGSTVAGGREFTILSFVSERTLVYLEDIGSAHYLRKPDDVARYSLTFDHLRASALRDDKSRALIRGGR